jgi:N-acyl homoserine lactone hydrolase
MTDETRLYVFDGGVNTLPLKNYSLGRGDGDERITVPFEWYLITHPRGHAIVDGGCAPQVVDHREEHLGPITSHSTIDVEEEHLVLPGLERIGVSLESIRWVVQSHLHFDHTGALAVIEELPNAEVIVTETEYQFAHAPDDLAIDGYCRKDYVKPGVKWQTLADWEDGYDLYGDGTLRCWRTPGHSPGHQSLEVKLSSGRKVLLTVDAANALPHFRGEELPGWLTNVTDTLWSAKRLRRLAWAMDAFVIAGHDPWQWPTLTKAPEYYA